MCLSEIWHTVLNMLPNMLQAACQDLGQPQVKGRGGILLRLWLLNTQVKPAQLPNRRPLCSATGSHHIDHQCSVMQTFMHHLDPHALSYRLSRTMQMGMLCDSSRMSQAAHWTRVNALQCDLADHKSGINPDTLLLLHCMSMLVLP